MEITHIFHHALDRNLATFPSRTADIVRRRFGIGYERPETLEAIGTNYDITRERVRQIIRTSLDHLMTHADKEFLEAQNILTEHVKAQGGIIHLNRLLAHFASSHAIDESILTFFIATSPDIFLIKKHTAHPMADAVHVKEFDFEQWEGFHKKVYHFLQKNEGLCTHDDLYAFVKKEYKYIDSAHLAEHLHVSTKIKQNPFGKWGLAQWTTVQPRSIRDKVFLILDYYRKPMHFREIAAEIDKHHLNKGGKKTHPQTVHNELIKDDRFVLAGRGIYKIASEDYLAGTIRDIIVEILTQASGPLTFEEIVSRVLQQRTVQQTTIRINLYAVANKDGNAYTLK